ncbi:MAG: response regulator FixJ [Terricaulis sp.]|jgi:two-component system response regulator FixJ
MNELVVHVVDDDAAMRDSIGFLLESASLKSRQYDSARALLRRVAELEPGCVLTDIRMPEMSGLDLVHELKRLGIAHPVIVLTGHADVALAVEAMKAGVVEFLEKPFAQTALLGALREALARGEGQANKQRDRAEIAQRISQLTARERDVFEAIVLGDSNKTAGLRLGISPRTVEIYRANVMAKMKAHSLSALVRMALRRDEA